MPVQNSARFKALVQDFCTTIVELSGRSADPELIAQDLALRIATNSRTLRVTEATALRQYIDDDWSKDMARQVWRETMRTVGAEVEPAVLPVVLVTRLLAGLGQAQICAAANSGPAGRPDRQVQDVIDALKASPVRSTDPGL